jgi:16S rRNA (uracil1498-N3)-methyltransferase
MTRHRIVVPPKQWPVIAQDHSVILPSEFAHYLSTVLRLNTGSLLELCDGSHNRWLAEIGNCSKSDIQLYLREKLPPSSPIFQVYLAQALAKGDRFEQIIQRCTELGVCGFFPFVSEHCVVRLKAERLHTRLERWQRVLRDAARQSHRANIPEIHPPITLQQLPDILPAELPKLVCWEKEHGLSLKSWLQTNSWCKGVVVIIGPEGGFSAEEIATLAERDIVSVGLGPLILRTENAGPTVAAILQFALGSLGGIDL